jgi:hypothetical protein
MNTKNLPPSADLLNMGSQLTIVDEPQKQEVAPNMQKAQGELNGDAFGSSSSFELALRMAEMLCSSSMVPNTYQGKNKVGDCLIMLNLSQRMGCDPLMLMQNVDTIHGRPSLRSQFLIALFNQTKRFSGIRYQFQGVEGTDDWGCRAVATELSTGEVLTGPLVTIGMAKKEGWYAKNGSKWQSMPDVMLRYRSSAFLIRTTAPEIAMGMPTIEEQYDIKDTRTQDETYSNMTSFLEMEAG